MRTREVKAMRGQFLSQQQLEDMLNVSSTAAIVEMLERSGYKEDLVSLSLKFKDA